MPPTFDPQFDSLVPDTPVSRRDFLATAIGAGFALAVQPVCAQTQVLTSSDGLQVGMIELAAPDRGIPAYYARPATLAKGRRMPTVLVVSEIFGVHEYIKDVCRRLAKQGYLAIAPELFIRQGDPQKLDSIPKILSEIIAKVPDAQVFADLDAAAAWAAHNGGDPARLAITGFCWGGRMAWLYNAHNPAIKTSIAWYGKLVGEASALTPRQPVDRADDLHGPGLGLYAGDDQGIPLPTVEKMRAALAVARNRSAQASQIHVYPAVPHAFHADYRPSYRKTEADDGWQRLLVWLKRHGV